MTVNFSAKLGVSRLTNGNMEMMNGAELYDYYASFTNADDITFSRWTPELRNCDFSWWDLASQTGFTQDYNISLSGGSDKIQSYFSLGYYDETGAVKGYDYTRYSFRYRTTYKPFKWLTIKPNVSGSMIDIYDAQYDVSSMYTMFPWDSPYDEDGNLVPDRYSGWVDSSDTNYLNSLANGDHTDYKTYEFTGNFDFDIRFTDWLTFTSVNSYRYKDITIPSIQIRIQIVLLVCKVVLQNIRVTQHGFIQTNILLLIKHLGINTPCKLCWRMNFCLLRLKLFLLWEQGLFLGLVYLMQLLRQNLLEEALRNGQNNLIL